MHVALSPKLVLQGLKEQPTALLVHGGKLFVGTSTGSLLVYSLREDGSDAEVVEHKKTFSPKGKPIDQLAVIKEVNILISRSDASIWMHSLTDLEPSGPAPIPQSKGALTFTLDTSVQKRPKLGHDTANVGTIGQSTLRKGAAYRVGGTIRKGGTLNSKIVASLRGMDQLAQEKEAKKKQLREGALGLGQDSGIEDDTEMTLVSVLAIGLRRKLIFLRWVDGEFWDTKEIALPHSPRSIVFSTPTSLFIGYSLTDYATLRVPLAAESSVAWIYRQDTISTSRGIPESSTAGKLVDVVEWDEAKEISLPSLPIGTVNQQQDISTASAGGYGVGLGAAFGSIGAYVGMSGGRQRDPRVISIDEEELLIGRETMGIFLTAEGKPSRRDGIDWPTTPESTVFLRPYILSVLPPTGASFSSKLTFNYGAGAPATSKTTIQVLSARTLAEVQNLTLPTGAPDEKDATTQVRLIHLPTLSAGGKPPLYIVSSPADRSILEKDGVMIWRLEMEHWGTQIDELVRKGGFEEALALLDSIDQIILEDKEQRRIQVQNLYAVHLFSTQKFDDAIEIFLALDTNPAQVLTLYPEEISGALSHPRSQWFSVFGAEENYEIDPLPTAKGTVDATESSIETIGSVIPAPSRASPRGTPILRDRSRLGSLLAGRRPQSIYGDQLTQQVPQQFSPTSTPLGSSPNQIASVSPSRAGKVIGKPFAPEDDDAGSVRSFNSVMTTRREKKLLKDDAFRASLDALGKFLADRRRIFKPLLESHPESHVAQSKSQEHRDVSQLLAIPSAPLSTLTLDQLSDVAQVVDTALLKTFLEMKPALIGPLCRLENWCKVEEVEELLQERKKVSELIALYGGKDMHMKALKLLRKSGQKEGDEAERLGPTIRYLQNLDPKHIDVILEAAHWVLDEDTDLGLEIFTADTGKVSSFPRFAIVEDLEQFSPLLCIRYLEFIIGSLNESEPSLHEKLLFLYLRRATELRKSGEQEERAALLKKLLAFVEISRQYGAECVLGRLPPAQEDLYEIRAALLGRLGNHDAALSLYVHVLKNVHQAEEYCKRVWTTRESRADNDVFLTLIKVLLRPDGANGQDSSRQAQSESSAAETPGLPVLDEAIRIIVRHGARIDAVAAFELLPPMVPMQSLEAFMSRVLQITTAERHDAGVVSSVLKARDHQLDHGLMSLKSKHVKVTETRICPRCGKKLGNSAGITVKPISGIVTHYFCREDGATADDALARRMRLRDLYL
ncbi:hypothetical protein K437DRAFT_232725 [Tilletiaria anomala UBC 951]|uniref:CNH domain-containing protein n=1 Tax=Tilletiaria anomala (strain ATCC 24038 / CBS 436.72 / UBC 951) TaxID=1037660 RepID=A0A066WMA1_TILAU|nr:uncharacterized protein K437DRAFT_232725 [Tilletiaria anomala UBC 951]KDN52129.1 hypothetical protein K437DRAFT_232725 [Tilletiaria anomala UBC 951]